MQLSSIPAKFRAIIATSGAAQVRTVPTASQIGVVNGAASIVDGFPPLTAQPIASGGVPPDIRDMNGFLQIFSAWLQWQNAGAPVQFDNAFASAVGGYPNGAVVATNPLGGFWRSTADNNTNNPDSGGANWTGLGALKNALVFQSNGTFTTPSGVTSLKVRVWGGGGAGGVVSGGSGAGAPGGPGGYLECWIPIQPGTVVPVTVGAGGAANTSGTGSGNGGPGGNSSFGSYCGCFGGSGGSGTTTGGIAPGTSTAGGAIYATGLIAFVPSPLGGQNAGAIGGTFLGPGGNPSFGGSGPGIQSGSANGPNGCYPGGGASGGVSNNGNAYNGGNGAAGLVIVEWA